MARFRSPNLPNGGAGREQRDPFQYASDDEKARRDQKQRWQMDAAKGAHQARLRLTEQPQIMECAAPRPLILRGNLCSHKIDYGT